MSVLKNSMSALSEEMAALRYTVRQMDERTMRGEQVLLEMQGQQTKMSRAVERIAEVLNVKPDERKRS